jgi:hypothetical protein
MATTMDADRRGRLTVRARRYVLAFVAGMHVVKTGGNFDGCIHRGPVSQCIQVWSTDGRRASNTFDKATGLTADRLRNVMETQ